MAEPTTYCVCQQADGAGIMIECIRGSGGCNGWVHPSCCGLILTQEELEALDAYICPLCEKPDDDFAHMTACNTSLANRQAKRERKRKLLAAERDKKPARKPWTCAACQHANRDRRTRECEACHTRRVVADKSRQHKSHSHKEPSDDEKSRRLAQQLQDERRHSQRAANKKRKSYHVPNSDEDLGSDDSDDVYKKKHKKHKKRRREDDDGSDSDEAEFQLDTSKLKDRTKTEPQEQPVVANMVIDKIMGVRQRDVEEPAPAPVADSASANLFANRPTKTSITEYLIKWKGFAYMHATWETAQVLLELDPLTNKQKIKRFHEKEQHRLHHPHRQTGDLNDESLAVDELEYFNPEYLEIHRIIAHRKDTPMPADPNFPDAPVDDGMRYYIKWRVLPYTEATWERACDIKDDVALAKYKASIVVPDEEVWQPRPRPSLREYRKLDESPRFGEDQSLSLRAYQLEGLNWLLWNWYNERPSILADEMGLGKTIQTLSFLNLLRDDPKIKIRGPFLIVAPLSLIVQWQNECETWTTMNCVVYHGNGGSRDIIRDYEFHYLDENLRPERKKSYRFNILVTTYEVAIKDIAVLSKIHWRCLVVDEAHRLKNQSSRLVEQMRSLRRDHCVLLTGTPLQNKTEELWALLNFLDGKSFPSVSDFLDKFGDLHEAQQVADLHKMLKPYLLRRVKEDVEKSLPPKEETIVEVELTPVQKQWYRAIYEKNTTFLNRSGNPRNVPNLMNVMMELRKCCNHPYLNNGVEEILNEGLTTDAQRHEMMVKCCGKMVLIDKLLPRLNDGGHKVLIFSQMVRVLDIIEDYLRYCGYLYERLDGNIRGNDRQAAVDRFVKPEYKRFVMLLSTKAGGLGLNLTAADTVIIFDSDWNPQNDLQAQARAHRIGQTHSVKIYRLITRKTYEMHMFHKASLKLGLDKAVLTHMRRENEEEGGKKRNKSAKAQESKEIDELLKRGAYDVFRDDDTAGEQFCELDIDQILQRSSQIVQYAEQAQSSFSKASFVSATTSDDVDLDDPDFWKKAVGLSEPDLAETEDLLPQQRKRTRVARFGDGGSFSDGSVSDDEYEQEKREKEKEERERLEEKNIPREWTQNGRDRLQRALMHYGFGRWEIIRSQSGGSRSMKEVELFARGFIYVSGLACDQRKDDSSFVKASIHAATTAQKENLIDEEELSSVLKEEDFVLKSKQGGGRRVLVRLDMLQRLQQLVTSACDACDELYKDTEDSSKPRPKPTACIDERARYYGADKLIPHIDLVDVGERPAWTQITPWWNEEADRNLLMGVFLHGYGRCAQILADPRLHFARLENAARVQQEANNGVILNQNGVASSSGDSVKKERTASAERGDDVDMSDVDSESASSSVNDDNTPKSSGSSIPFKTETGGTGTANTTVAMTEADTFKQPEVQHMNRLLGWLLSAEEIKRRHEKERFKKERVAVEQRRQVAQEMRARSMTLRRLELKAMQLAQVDILRHMAVLHNARQLPDPTLVAPPQHRMKNSDWTKEERRSFAYMMALHGAPRILAKRAVVALDGRATPSMLPFVTEQARPFSWETDSISWLNIVEWGNLNKTATLARTFYETKFAPKCREVARMRADPLGSDQRAVALGDLIGIEFVDAFEGVLAHGLKARNTAWVTMRRTQLLEDMLDILTTKRGALEDYLRSGKQSLVEDMPVWWCPWIHDLGVIYGMAHYGVYGWERIMLDRQLPFHRQAREHHIRAVFLEGTPTFRPLYRHHFESAAEMNAWFVRVLNEFPSLSVLERKVESICAAVLEEYGTTVDRYVEPEDRREFSLSPPGNCFEELILARVKHEEELLPSIEPVIAVNTSGEPASSTSGPPEALAAFLSESQSRRDEYLRAAEASNAIGSISSSSAATEQPSAVVTNGQHTQAEEDEQRQQTTSSQVLLVS
ncbi:Chromodomain-helicase-DNA-binding protein 6 [Phytophthora fragariae]|uniref:Chromodomain-helicase-DNA-binding protein 6 n=1 Tax=Phytophthora fragariae TaxID=53985 RepID=A0A6G0LA19_9STRA|nr:Chromodomain-helicase-DNA-binding protein 6 [Phytophthora fragariae]